MNNNINYIFKKIIIMKKIMRSYNNNNYEEKKEDNYNKDNNIYPNLQIEGIINDLKMKGYNNFQIKDIISSIQKNNTVQKNRVANYINNNQEHKNIDFKMEQDKNNIRYDECFINGGEKKLRNEYNKFNTTIYISNNISENKNKIINDVIPKKKFSEKINIPITQPILKKNNQQIIQSKNMNNQINYLFHNYGEIIKRRQKNEYFNDSKNTFNNYSFYNSNNKNKIIKEINNGLNDKIKAMNYKGKKILKYTNKKHKKSDNNIDQHKNNHQMLNHNDSKYKSQYYDAKIMQNFFENNNQNQILDNNYNENNNTSRGKIRNTKQIINKQKSERQLKNNLLFKNLKQNENSINNEIHKNNKKVIFCQKNPTNIKYNNYNYHDISKDNSYTNIKNNKKKYFINHFNSNICMHKIKNKDNSKDIQKKTIDNSSDNIKINEDMKNIKNIKFDKNIKLTKKKASYNNISKNLYMI